MPTSRRFEYTDTKSSKFWTVSVAGKTVAVRYGRIGTNGQEQVKIHASPLAAAAAAEKQVSEKLKKGYREIKTKQVPKRARAEIAATSPANVSTPDNRAPRLASPRKVSQSRGGKTADRVDYISVGHQKWMARNLDVLRFRNGDSIYEAKTAKAWDSAIAKEIPAWCYYEFKKLNGARYGKLYNWEAVVDKRGLAPEGWHIPTGEEWWTYFNLSGDWNAGEGHAPSKYRFPLGGHLYLGFEGCGVSGRWWSAPNTKLRPRNVSPNGFYAWPKPRFLVPQAGIYTHNNLYHCGFSVICLQDDSGSP